MNRNQLMKNNISYKTYIFWSIMGLLTLLFIGFSTIKIVEKYSKQTMDDMVNLYEEQVLNQVGTYYVYVYSKVGITDSKYELEKAKELEETITNYLTYAKRNKNATKIYGMIVDDGSKNYGNYQVLVDGTSFTTMIEQVTSFSKIRIHKEDVPMLFKVTNGKIAKQYLKESEIREELQTAIGIK